jgi:hypothetical protein
MMTLASGFYSMHNISHTLTPDSLLPPENEIQSPLLDGIREIVADTFVLKVMQSLTNVFIILVSEPSAANQQTTLIKKVYEAYSDYA